MAVRAARATVAMSPFCSIEKPSTGLPVVAIASTTRLVHSGSMPITTQAATLGFAAGADDGAEVQVEVGAELQPAVGVGQGHGALDVVGDALAGGVGDVVDRQDDDVVPHPDPPVLAAVAEEMVAVADVISPPLRLDVVGVDVAADRDVLDRLADVVLVLEHGLALLHRPDRHLVAERHVGLAPTLMVASVSITQPASSWPALASSTTTTPTVSACVVDDEIGPLRHLFASPALIRART